MLAWIALLFMLVVEAIAIKWWLATQLYPLFFNDWAVFLYGLLILVDVAIAWLISMLYEPGGTMGLQILLAIAIAVTVLVGLGTLFIRWVVHLDMTDITKRDK